MKKFIFKTIAVIFILFVYSVSFAGDNLMLFCGAAFKQPINEVIQLFLEKSGTEINVTYSNASALFSQILLSRKGDLLIVPSPDLMEKAKSRNVIHPDSGVSFAYISPVINVRKGNPKKIMSLDDLSRPGVRIALGNPKTVFAGMLAVEIIDKGLLPEQIIAVKKNMAVYAEDFAKLTFILKVNQVDAIIGLHYLAELYPEEIEAVQLKPEQVHRIGCGQAAVLSYSKNAKSAQKFIDFLLSKEGQQIFSKYHYFRTSEEADAWVGARKPVGGVYEIPQDWLRN